MFIYPHAHHCTFRAPEVAKPFSSLWYTRKDCRSSKEGVNVVTVETMPRPGAGQIPAGVADYFWGEAYERRTLEDTLLAFFRRWGYSDVTTPAFEYAETWIASGSWAEQAELCRFLDRDGSMLALRPDMTIPVARLAGARLHDVATPQRFCYAGNVFRDVESRAGQQREFWQAGVELLGSAAPAADAEVLALTAQALDGVGIASYRLVVGQMLYFDGLLRSLQLTPAQQARLTQAIDRNSQPELDDFLRAARLPRRQQRALAEVPHLGGSNVDDILRRAERLALNVAMQEAVANLRAICETLAAYDVLDRVTLDLSEIHNLGYYTGITFEVLAPGVGFRIASGGRYDNLVGAFGKAMPAVGVAFGLERVLLAQRGGTAAPAPQPIAPDLVVAAGSRRAAFAFVEMARQRGLRVAVEVDGRSGGALWQAAQAAGASYALDWSDAQPVLYSAAGSRPVAGRDDAETADLLLSALAGERSANDAADTRQAVQA